AAATTPTTTAAATTAAAATAAAAVTTGREARVYHAAAVHGGRTDDASGAGRGTRHVGECGDGVHRGDHGGDWGEPRRWVVVRDDERERGEWRGDVLDVKHQQPRDWLHAHHQFERADGRFEHLVQYHGAAATAAATATAAAAATTTTAAATTATTTTGRESRVYHAAPVHGGRTDDASGAGRGTRHVGECGDGVHRGDHGGDWGEPRRWDVVRDDERERGEWRGHVLDVNHQQPRDWLHAHRQFERADGRFEHLVQYHG